MRATRAPLRFSIGAMLALALVLWQAFGLPEVEDPFPDRIGLEVLVSFAGAGGVLAGVLCIGSSPAKKERAVSLGALFGFCLGAVYYILSLLAQIASAL